MLVTLLVLTSLTSVQSGHMSFNTSDVITTYTGHADAVPEVRKSGTDFRKSGTDYRVRDTFGERKGDKVKSEEVRKEGRQESGGKQKGEQDEGADSDYLEQTTAASAVTEPSNDVVFIPSHNSDVQSFSRRLGSGRKDEYNVKDMMERVDMGDVINERVRVETEAPKDGVVFITGKNNEQTEEKIKHELDDDKIEKAVKEYKEIHENPMDCENLDCENVVESVCGVKVENKRPKHRLFKNECFFRKVNCGLRYDYNRYRTVPLEECDTVGSHAPIQEQPQWMQYHPKPPPRPTSARRSASRRAMTASAQGLPCDHKCPLRCPDEYAPVCAYTFPKQARVFQNHCLLDLQSCNDGSVWQERSLAECAGDVRAEVHERAAFIGWMQRMGILDKKGHLVM